MEVIKTIVYIIILASLGTILRYYLTQIKYNDIIDGLMLANLLGILVAILCIDIYPLFVIAFCGSLTSFSSFIKNGYNYKSKSYLIIHFVIYVSCSKLLFELF